MFQGPVWGRSVLNAWGVLEVFTYLEVCICKRRRVWRIKNSCREEVVRYVRLLTVDCKN